MSDFEKWFRSLNANGKTVYFLGNEHKVSEMAWNHQQAIIDEHTEVIKLQDADLRKYEKQIESLQAQLAVYKEDMAKDAEKIVELTNKIEKPCRWCGFENKRGAND